MIPSILNLTSSHTRDEVIAGSARHVRGAGIGCRAAGGGLGAGQRERGRVGSRAWVLLRGGAAASRGARGRPEGRWRCGKPLNSELSESGSFPFLPPGKSCSEQVELSGFAPFQISSFSYSLCGVCLSITDSNLSLLKRCCSWARWFMKVIPAQSRLTG